MGVLGICKFLLHKTDFFPMHYGTFQEAKFSPVPEKIPCKEIGSDTAMYLGTAMQCEKQNIVICI